MPRGLRKKTKQYVLDRFQEEDPVEYFKYKTKSSHGLTMDQMEILQAVESQSVQKIRSMLNRGVDPNFMAARALQTPLHLAVENKGGSDAACEKIVGVLLFFGANSNAQDERGNSPLHLACMNGNAANVELLLQAGADVNIFDDTGETPLMTACRHLCDKSGHIIDLLLTHGVDGTFVNSMHQSVFHCISFGRTSKSDSIRNLKDRHLHVRTLLKHGLNANTADNKGLSALCYELCLLLGSDGTSPWMLSTAKELVCGGALMHLPQDCAELEYFIRRNVNTITASTSSAFVRLANDLQHDIPRAQFKVLQRLAQRTNTSPTGATHAVAESTPSLTRLCRIAVRQCLNGCVYVNVKFLPVPDKIKDFICSCD